MEQLNLKADPPTSSLSVESDLNDGDDDIDFWGEDETIDNSADNGLNHSSALDREWQMRHEQFHTMGYRDGITAGKEASAQEGFNVGFKQSVRNGYNWGLVRGISSVYANLPNHLKEKLGGRVEKRERLLNLYQNVQTISTTDALKMFHQSIQKTETRVEHLESDSHLIIENEQHSSFNQLDSLHMELTSLLKDSPEIKITMEPA